MTEFNVTVNVFDVNRVRLVHHIRLYREYREYLFGGCKRGLKPVELFRKALDGVEKLRDIHIERDKCTARDGLTEECRILDIASSAEVQEAHYRGNIQHIHKRTEDTEDEYLLLLSLAELVVFLFKLLLFEFLAVEHLNYLHTGKMLREICVDISRRVLYFTVGFA